MSYLAILNFITEKVEIIQIIEGEDFHIEEFLTNDLDEYLTDRGYDTSNIQWMHCPTKPEVIFDCDYYRNQRTKQ